MGAKSPDSAFKEQGNFDLDELSTPGAAGLEQIGNPLEFGADHAIVVDTLGKRSYCEVFGQTSIPDAVSLILLKKCGWFCMLVKFRGLSLHLSSRLLHKVCYRT